MNRRELGYAVLLSLPVGVGVWLAVLKFTRSRRPVLAVAAGALVSAVIFLVVVAGVRPPED